VTSSQGCKRSTSSARSLITGLSCGDGDPNCARSSAGTPAPRPIDRKLVQSLRHITTEAVSIRRQLSTIKIDDTVNAIDIAVGKSPRAAEILMALHKRRATLRRNED